MAITIGQQLGSYAITALLGKGGMGEVYRARDTKLKRDVAIKILPDEFSRDSDRATRFQREAEVLASLNHPNIGAIYDLAETNGTRFLVLELVEGETLADRIQRGPVPVEETLRIAQSICEALEAAHERGIIHRDLKPANVKITPNGKVKVLDFGLAKATEKASGTSTLSNSPTMVSATVGGMILGTAAYMSPEQARGRAADTRSDVFAFGCVLYEMLTGRQAFPGKEVSDVLASVLKTQPDWNLLPRDLNPTIHRVLRRALEKDPRRRWYAIGDVRVELETVLANGTELVSAPEPVTQVWPLWKRAVAMLIIAIVVAIAAATTAWNLKPSPPGAITRLSLTLPQGQQFTGTSRRKLALSPDGSHVAYIANQQLFLRSISETEARPLSGATDAAATTGPFFSPDGQWIGFHSSADSWLKKISITGGAPTQICKVPAIYSAGWDGDYIVFSDSEKGVMRVRAGGGEPEVLVPIKPEEGTAYAPQIINDGKAVLFTLGAPGLGADRWSRAQIVVQLLSSNERKIIAGGTQARYLPTGHIVYVLGDRLFAIPFDARTLESKGIPVPVLEGIQHGVPAAAADVAFSENGTAIYIPRAAGTAARRMLAIVDRSGKAQTLPIMPGPYRTPRISPDGTQLAFDADQQIWVYDFVRASVPRLLTFAGRNVFPVWAGQYIIFQSSLESEVALYRQAADGTGVSERVTKSEPGILNVPFSVDPSGTVLAVLHAKGLLGSNSISFLSLSGNSRVPEPLTDVPSSNAAFSPDGRWLAYSVPVGDRYQVFVRPYPGLKATYQVTDNGNFPVWSRNGKQLFFVRPPARFFSVDVQTNSSFSTDQPVQLPITGTVHDFRNDPKNYDVTPDGKFVVVLPASPEEASQQTTPQINVVLNWFRDLQQRVPVK